MSSANAIWRPPYASSRMRPAWRFWASDNNPKGVWAAGPNANNDGLPSTSNHRAADLVRGGARDSCLRPVEDMHDAPVGHCCQPDALQIRLRHRQARRSAGEGSARASARVARHRTREPSGRVCRGGSRSDPWLPASRYPYATRSMRRLRSSSSPARPAAIRRHGTSCGRDRRGNTRKVRRDR